MYGYVYKTTNLINGRLYIGQKSGKFEGSYLGSGKILKKAFKKYGRNNFKLEVIAFANSKKMLNYLEIKNISEYRNSFGAGFLYNIADGGMGGRHKNCSCLVCKRMRGEAENHTKGHKDNCQCATCKAHRGEQKGKNNPNFGNRLSKEMKDKIGKVNSHPRQHPITCQCPFCKSRRAKAIYVYEVETLSDIKKSLGII